MSMHEDVGHAHPGTAPRAPSVVALHGLTAREVFHAVAKGRFDAMAERRARIEAALERLADLRDSLIAKLDAIDPDPDLEPSLGSTMAVNLRAWAFGALNDAEDEHDGREHEDGI